MTQHRQNIAWEGEGVESSVAITITNGASFVVNGKNDGNIRGDAGTQVLGGLIGAALKPDVKTACVIGLGTGSTAGWLAAVPEIERVDAMELEPAVLEMARVCAMANQRVLENPKCHILLGDARELLITTRQKYDLIFSEPSNPYRAGIASLFTTEFYETARERMNTGGLFLQWVQAYEVDSDAIRMVLATLGGVFPHVEVWTTQTGDLLLVASAEPRTWDAASLRQRIQAEPFRTAVRRIWGVESAEGFLAHFAAGPELARKLSTLAAVPRNTDDNTLLEFAFARSVGRPSGFRTPELYRAAEEIGATRPLISGEVDWARVEEERLAMFAYDGYPPPVPATLSEQGKARCEIRRLVIEKLAAFGGHLWLEKKPEPLTPRDVETFAEALAEIGSDEALPFIERLRPSNPGEAATMIALLRTRQGRMDDAVPALVAAFAAYRLDPWPLLRVEAVALDLVAEIATANPRTAPIFFDALKPGPFPGFLLESARRETMVMLTLKKWETGQPVSNEGYALMEPWPTWTRDFLKSRYAFYKATGLGDSTQARKDLEAFLEADTASFDRGITEPKPGTAAR
jgi:spermidine synthase